MKSRHIYRQGDVVFEQIDRDPTKAEDHLGYSYEPKKLNRVIQEGENGGVHQLEPYVKAEHVQLTHNGRRYILAKEGVRVLHEEHDPIRLPAGNYEVRIQREWSPAGMRNVSD